MMVATQKSFPLLCLLSPGFQCQQKERKCSTGIYLSVSIGKDVEYRERESQGIKRKQECLCLWIAAIGTSKIHKIGRKGS